MSDIHWCDHADQPDLRIACTQTWTTPAWGVEQSAEPWLADDGRRYVFSDSKSLVTCKGCLARASEDRSKPPLGYTTFELQHRGCWHYNAPGTCDIGPCSKDEAGAIAAAWEHKDATAGKEI